MKKEFKGTPGPWEFSTIKESGETCTIIHNKGFDANSGDKEGVNAPDKTSICGIWGESDEESIADAHLIATAPELLESLQDMLDIIERIWFPGFDITKKKEYLQAKEVINKALEE